MENKEFDRLNKLAELYDMVKKADRELQLADAAAVEAHKRFDAIWSEYSVMLYHLPTKEEEV